MKDFLELILTFLILWLVNEYLLKLFLDIFHKKTKFFSLFLLSFITNFPEFIIVFYSALVVVSSSNVHEAVLTFGQIILGTVLGAVFAQLTLVLGLGGMLKVLHFKRKDIINKGSVLLFSLLVFAFLSLDGLISNGDAFILIILYFFYILFLIKTRTSFIDKARKSFIFFSKKRKLSNFLLVLKLTLSLFVVTEASRHLIYLILKITQFINISDYSFSFYFLGMGSSLPEMFITIAAITPFLKTRDNVSVSNIIGSTLVDLLLVLPIAALIRPIELPERVLSFDIPYIVFSSVIVISFLLSKKELERHESLLLFFLYIVYIILKFIGF